MQPERWRRIEDLYHAAVAFDPARRATYLSEACGGDRALRTEVEELLESDSRASGFIETPALHMLARQEARALEASAGFRLEAGARLGPYEILNALGAGGMGEIYTARDTRLGRTVAVKVLSTRMMDQAGFRERLAREARAVSNLNHPHICTLHDIGRDGDVDYLVMEYIEGQSLAERLKDGPLPGPEVLRIAIEIAEALECAHRQGVIHRDLKPGNIMLTGRGAKLVDFGLARWRDADDDGASPGPAENDTSRTQAGAVMGTPQYMAPEQMGPGPVDARTDIFSLGAVIFEMASGGKALASTTDGGVTEIPVPLKTVIGRCLKPSPAERWQSAAALTIALNSIGGRNRSKRWIVAVGVVATAAAGVLILQAVNRPEPAAVEQVLYTFTGQKGDGMNSAANVVAGKNGYLYGSTSHGGAFGKGTIYELRPPTSPAAAWTESVLYSFTGKSDGDQPLPGVTVGSNGVLYGVTEFGGDFGKGTVYALTPGLPGGSWTLRVLHSFSRRNGDAATPRSDLAIGPDGSLYGSSLYGGIPFEDGRGTVFQLTPPALAGGDWKEKVLYRFTGDDGGAYPYSNVVFGADGSLYGTTVNGSAGVGSAYKLSPPLDSAGNWTATILHRFTGTNGDGRSPAGDIAVDQHGAIFGTTQKGGKGENGTVFKLKPPESVEGEWTYQVLHRFTSQIGDGAEPASGIVLGDGGSLYGTTIKGGAWGNGTVFKLTQIKGAWTVSILYNFSGNKGDGSRPTCLGRMLLDRGALYGTTEFGGAFNAGTVFRLMLPKGH